MAEPRRITEDRYISAGEVNRFCYCPWQWYYERVYGAAELRRRVKERNDALGLAPVDDAHSPFAIGRAFHQNYRRRYAARRRRRLAAGLVALAACLVWAWLRYVGL